jgi:hypothetical protein
VIERPGVVISPNFGLGQRLLALGTEFMSKGFQIGPNPSSRARIPENVEAAVKAARDML